MLQYLQLMLIGIAAVTFLLGTVLQFRFPLIKQMVKDKRKEEEKDEVKQLLVKDEEDKLEEFVVGAMSKLEL